MTTTTTRLITDEWVAEHYLGGMMTRGQMEDAGELLDILPDLVGPVPVEVTAFLRMLVAERDARVWNFLTSLDEAARS